MGFTQEDYYNKVRLSVLVSFDIIIINSKKEILLGKRKNDPAKDYYFTPGGSIYKNETFQQSINRISLNEIGIKLSLNDLKLNGIYSHIYDNNFKDNKFSTHYINFAFIHELKENQKFNLDLFAKQHSQFVWLSKEEIMKNNLVHDNVKKYFIENADNKLIVENN